MDTNINVLKNKYLNRDIYVIGSGPTLNHVNLSFFVGKICVGVNNIFRIIKCDYVVAKDQVDYKDIYDSGADIVSPEYIHGRDIPDISKNCFEDHWFSYKHFNVDRRFFDIRPLDIKGMLVFGNSVVVTAMHFAYHLGAKNIILCGFDCGSIDGKENIDNYYNNYDGIYKDLFCHNTEKQTILLANELRKRGRNVCSLNPFVNLGLEGHIYKRF